MTQNRKRGRNIHEEEMEFMPLSKRINNLHINNSLLMNSTNVHQPVPINTTEWGPGPPFLQNNTLPPNIPTPPESVQSIDWNNSVPHYSPELNEEAATERKRHVNLKLYNNYLDYVKIQKKLYY